MGPRLKLPPFVHHFLDRHGRPRFYFRRRGYKQVPLPGLPWSPQFMAAREVAMGSPAAPEVGASRTMPGTVNALVVSYFGSNDWSRLARDTRRTRKPIIERFRVQHGDKRVALLRQEHLLKMLAEIEKPLAKRHWLRAIRGLLKAAVPSMRNDDPTAGIAGIKLPKSKGHHTWTNEEIKQYRDYWPLGTQARLTLEFALETASRRGEIVRLGPQHIKDGRIRIERTKGSRDVDILITPELQAACDAMPKGHLTYLVTAYGEPRTKYGLGNSFAEWATKAGLPKRCRLHGLKKGGMRRLAEARLTTHELMAISGHKTLSEVQRYTEEADRRLLADSGMAKRNQTVNIRVANLGSRSGKPAKKPA
jgi:integrase